MSSMSKDHIIKKERLNNKFKKFIRLEDLSYDELTIENIEKFMDKNFKTISRQVFYHNVKILNEILNDNKINVFINCSKYVDDYVKIADEQYLILTEVQKLCIHIVNYQDKLIIYGLFKGIYGKNYSDLLNITRNDVAQDYSYINLESGKKFLCDDFMKEIICKCMKEKTYTKYVTSDEIKSSNHYELADDSVYLIRPMPKPKNNFGRNPLSASSLQRRFKKISEQYKDETGEDVILTGMSLIESGVFYDMFLQEINCNRDWSIEEIDKYLKKNGIKGNKADKYRRYYQRYYGTNRNM